MADRSRVSVVRCHDYGREQVAAAVQAVMRSLGGFAAFVAPGWPPCCTGDLPP